MLSPLAAYLEKCSLCLCIAFELEKKLKFAEMGTSIIRLDLDRLGESRERVFRTLERKEGKGLILLKR